MTFHDWCQRWSDRMGDFFTHPAMDLVASALFIAAVAVAAAFFFTRFFE